VGDIGVILSNPKRGEAFKAFLAERGCDLLAPTNKYEALRFKRAGRTNIVYRNARGRFTTVGGDIELAVAAFAASERKGGGKPRIVMAIPPAIEGEGGGGLGDDLQRRVKWASQSCVWTSTA